MYNLFTCLPYSLYMYKSKKEITELNCFFVPYYQVEDPQSAVRTNNEKLILKRNGTNQILFQAFINIKQYKTINDAKYELKKISHVTQPKLNFRLKLLKCKKKETLKTKA